MWELQYSRNSAEFANKLIDPKLPCMEVLTHEVEFRIFRLTNIHTQHLQATAYFLLFLLILIVLGI